MKLVVTLEEQRALNDAVLEGANLVTDNPAAYRVSRVVVDLPGLPRCLVPVEVESAHPARVVPLD